MAGRIDYHESYDPWSGRQPRYERLVSDGAGRFFVDARLPSGELVRSQLGRFTFSMRSLPPTVRDRRWGRRGIVARLHNPRNRVCACLPECWCKWSGLGYLVRWYTPARWHRLPPRPAVGRK